MDEEVRNVLIDKAQMDPILTHLAKFDYASLRHVSLTLLWNTMMRIGAAHALDLEDYHSEGQYLEIIHRPEQGTAIKNKKRGERFVALSEDTCALLDNWVENKRPSVTDDFDRNPLLTTNQGRMAKSTIRDYVYQETRPCSISLNCPDGRDIEVCKATHRDHAAECPFNVSPHAIRRGSITNALNNDVPSRIVGDRANVSQSVLEKHYDRRSQKEKMEQRRGFLENL
ncbi:MAG: tyrosine-type recombinase/integrase [Halanaeroarchaeum sp.]